MRLSAIIDEHEMTALAVEAAQAHKEIARLEDERKSLNKDIKGRQAARDVALAAVNTGYREKDVQVECGYDWVNGRKYTKRLDTGDLIDAHGTPIDDDERQMQLDGLDASGIIAATTDDEGAGLGPDDDGFIDAESLNTEEDDADEGTEN